MNIDQRCMQGCINSYGGEYGNFITVFEKWQLFKNTHVEGYFARYNDDLFIVFRGSDGTPDWIDNFKFWKRDTPYRESGTKKRIKIHSGFLGQYMLIRNIVHAKVEKHLQEYPSSKIYVSGHSLGGALAQVCAIDVQYNFFPFILEATDRLECITFGSTRVGNWAFKKSFNKRVLNARRYVNGDDVVCKIPPSIMFFKHTAMKIKIGKRSFLGFFFGSKDDHYPKEYMKNL